jgi:hypothetical protein
MVQKGKIANKALQQIPWWKNTKTLIGVRVFDYVD